jgi:hypothetical protein
MLWVNVSTGLGISLFSITMVAMPFLNRAQAAHPAFERSVAQLRAWGVRVLYGPGVFELHEPGTGAQRVHLFPWRLVLVEVMGSIADQES